MGTKRDIQIQFVMDVVENISKGKKKKLERGQIVCDVKMQLGLNADGSHLLVKELLGAYCVIMKDCLPLITQGFELTKALINLLNTPLSQPDGTQTR